MPEPRPRNARASSSEEAGRDASGACWSNVRLLAELGLVRGESAADFGEILDALDAAVTIRTRDERIVYANRAALRLAGLESLAELQRRRPRSLMRDYVVTDENGRELALEDIPSVRLLRGLPADPLLMRSVHRRTGELLWMMLKASALRDERGDVAATVMIVEDVTTVKTAELRNHFLAEVSRLVGSSLDYEQTLHNLAEAAVPRIADWCVVDLVAGDGRLKRLVAAHRDPDKLPLADRLREFEPTEPDLQHGRGRVVRTGISQLYRHMPDKLLRHTAANAEHLGLLRELGTRSIVLVPIRSPTRVLGALTLVSGESRRRFAEDDVAFAEQVADCAAVAVENALLYRSQAQTAETLQRSLLPDRVPRLRGWRVATMYRPAGGERPVEVGGDFYDFIETDGGWLVIIGDVTGKGVRAAALTSMLRHGARVAGQTDSSPAAILDRLDVALAQRAELSLCTALCLLLGEERITMCSAGHPLPLAISPGGDVREVGSPQRLLGLREPHRRRDEEISVDPDAMIVLHTDGITDVRGKRERFGERRLHRVLAQLAGAHPDKLVAGLEAALTSFQAGSQTDDTAVIALRRRTVAAIDAVPRKRSGMGRRAPLPRAARRRLGSG